MADNTPSSLEEILAEYGSQRAELYRELGNSPEYSNGAEKMKAEAIAAIEGLVPEKPDIDPKGYKSINLYVACQVSEKLGQIHVIDTIHRNFKGQGDSND